MREFCILLWICLSKQQGIDDFSASIMENAPLLPHFNRDFVQILAEKNYEKTLIASIGNAFIVRRGGEPTIELRVEYSCRWKKVCLGEFRLNGSQKLAEIERFSVTTGSDLTVTDGLETYYALLQLVPRREQGVAIVRFHITVIAHLNPEGHLDAQYLVHLQPPHKRVLTRGCTFRVQAYNKVNLMVFSLNPNPFMPSGMKWQKFVVYKRVSVKKPQDKQYLYVPIIVMTRSPFSTIPLTFYYFKEVTIELGDNGRLLVKGTTGNGLNLHDCGMYTVRWYTYDAAHIVDEECEDTSQVKFWGQPPPMAPIFAHTKRDTPAEWTFNLKELQAAVRQGPVSALLACVWTDVFQNIPKARDFALVITRRAFYSEGEELGFMMYAYLMTLTKPSLEGYVCHTESMALAGMRPYIPFPQGQNKFSISPAVSVSKRNLQFTIRGDYVCEKQVTSAAFTGIVVTAGNTGNFKARSTQSIGEDSCDNPHQSIVILLPGTLPWRQGSILKFTIHQTKGSVERVVPMDADNWVTVKPNRALYAQEVEISCFKERLRLLASNGVDITGLEHLEMSGEVGANNYLPIATYTPGFGYEVNTMNIDSSAKLKKESNDHFPSLTLTTIAYHLHNFHGFRCRMKFRNEQIPEYEVVNSGSVCFMRQPPPIEMTVDNISVPVVEDTTQESIPQNRNLQIFQTSCVKPETRLVFTCSQWREMETCEDAHTVDSVYNVDTDLIIYNAKRREYVIKKPVFDRLGRGRVDIPTVPYEWHTAEVVCHRTIRRTDNISHIILDQYSSAVRICVSQTTFAFYLAHTGFEWTKGLTMSLDDMINMGAVTKMEMGDEMNDVDVGSAVICQVTGDGSRVNETKIKQRNVEPENDIETVRIVGYENASIAMLMNADVDKKITFLALFCQTKRLESQIIERSEVLWLAVHEAVLKDEGFKEVNDLILYILLTVCASLLISVSCPLIARLSQRRQNRQRARYRKAVARRLKRLNYLREIGMHKVDVNGEFARELSPKTNIFTREHGKKDFKGKEFGPPPAASQNAGQITNTTHV